MTNNSAVHMKSTHTLLATDPINSRVNLHRINQTLEFPMTNKLNANIQSAKYTHVDICCILCMQTSFVCTYVY